MKIINILLCAAPSPSSPLAGPPISPRVPSVSPNAVLIRYMYDGGLISGGRLCYLEPKKENVATGLELVDVLRKDGVDFSKFYAALYETEASEGGWLPILRDEYGVGNEDVDSKTTDEEGGESQGGAESTEWQVGDVELPLPPPGRSKGIKRRVDVKLFRRRTEPGFVDRTFDATLAEADCSQITGKLPRSKGYFGVGVMGAKTQANIGTLWRSAYQLGAHFLFTVGQRYKSQSTDTVQAPTRIPLFELDDWSAFATFAPRGARWVAVEMGGTPLEDFEHPRDALYILGSEDNGVPASVVRACHEVVSLNSEKYASYNVAVAGSIVLYDRMVKLKAAERG